MLVSLVCVCFVVVVVVVVVVVTHLNGLVDLDPLGLEGGILVGQYGHAHVLLLVALHVAKVRLAHQTLVLHLNAEIQLSNTHTETEMNSS